MNRLLGNSNGSSNCHTKKKATDFKICLLSVIKHDATLRTDNDQYIYQSLKTVIREKLYTLEHMFLLKWGGEKRDNHNVSVGETHRRIFIIFII